MNDAAGRIVLWLVLLPLFADAHFEHRTGPSAACWIRFSDSSRVAQLVHATDLYALAQDITLPENFRDKTIELKLSVSLAFRQKMKAMWVISIVDADTLRFWDALSLEADRTDTVIYFEKTLLIPPDYLDAGKLRTYFWNPDGAVVEVQRSEIAIKPHRFPNMLPDASVSDTFGPYQLLLRTTLFQLHHYTKTGHLVLADAGGRPLTWPLVWYSQILSANDTLNFISENWVLKSQYFSTNQKKAMLRTNTPHEKVTIELSTDSLNGLGIFIKVKMRRKVQSYRQALVVTLLDNFRIIWDENGLSYDPAVLEQGIYLGKGGFVNGVADRRLTLISSTHLAALQIDPPNRRFVANLLFGPSHPLIQFPKDDLKQNYFIDLSAPNLPRGFVLKGGFTLWPGRGNKHLPRLMHLPGGAEAAVVWTEHADWTDIRTQRAVHFGCDTINHPENALGGFDKFCIPLTKSVFFHNPLFVTNEQASKGLFKGFHATLEQKDFQLLAKELHQQGHEICLHTPEQYTSRRAWMREALKWTRIQFGSTTWIDHGYNNSSQSNRENLVGDGLNKRRKHYSADLWEKNGIKYLWNPALEELQTYANYGIDANFIIPYPGYGPHLPKHVFYRHPLAKGFLLWHTTGTLEMPSDAIWDYMFSASRLERLMKYHSIWINHVYPAWTLPGKGFWYFDADSNLIAMQGLNRALERLSELGKSGRLLNTTLGFLASYYEALEKVELIPIDDNKLLIINNNPFAIEQITFLSTSHALQVPGHQLHKRAKGDQFLYWFNLMAGAKAVIHF